MITFLELIGILPPKAIKMSNRFDELPPLHDNVNQPAHYTDGKIEVIDFIEDKKLNFHLGNAVKYICRAGKKDPSKFVEDLEKAIWYIKREISVHESLSKK